jgi:hypothetical protein
MRDSRPQERWEEPHDVRVEVTLGECLTFDP